MLTTSTYAPRWAPLTAYTAGQAVLLPDGTTGTAKTGFTTTSTFDAANWNVASGGSVADADATTKGKVALAGDLSGAAAAPVVFKSVAVPGATSGRIARAFVGAGAPTGDIPGAVAGDTYRDTTTGTIYDISGS